MTNTYSKRRRAAALLATCVMIGGAACSDFLVAENPGAIEEPDVTSEQYVNLLANGPQYAFQLAWDDVTYWGPTLGVRCAEDVP